MESICKYYKFCENETDEMFPKHLIGKVFDLISEIQFC